MQSFYEITGTTAHGLAALLEQYGAAPLPQPYSLTDYHGSVAAFKKELLERALSAHRGNRTHAARALGLQRTYLIRLMKEYGIVMPSRQRPAQGSPGDEGSG